MTWFNRCRTRCGNLSIAASRRRDSAPVEMKVLAPRTTLRLILTWTQRVLFAGAAILLGYCAFVLVDTWMYQHRAAQTLTRLRTVRPASPASLVESPLPPLVGPDGVIGRIEVQRLGVSV